ncbi:MAG: hypothetical protein ACHBN1_04325 [Heteroscytonema crispum UTEX LB 1556]
MFQNNVNAIAVIEGTGDWVLGTSTKRQKIDGQMAEGKSLIFQNFHQMKWLAYFRPSILSKSQSFFQESDRQYFVT